MNIECVGGVQPLRHEEDPGTPNNKAAEKRIWRLTPLKTILELQEDEETVEVHVLQIPAKSANKVLRMLQGVESKAFGVDLQHLRRFAKFEDLPSHLKLLFSKSSAVSDDEAKVVPGLLYLIGALAAEVSVDHLKGLLCGIFEAPTSNCIWTIPVPLFAPISQEQADLWQEKFWPTVYKNSNPYGPHPSIVSRSQSEICKDVHIWMDLATQVGRSGKQKGIGEAIGVVIVERHGDQARAVAIAADARRRHGRRDGTGGNAMAHAVLRAIAMYCQKLKEEEPENERCFEDVPLLPEEQAIYDVTENRPGGYLCHNLEVYTTHEPCVMCSMALLHSRFGRVVFGQQMHKTGGLCSKFDQFYGHGLFWRKDLNWSMLAWEASVVGETCRNEVDQWIHV